MWFVAVAGAAGEMTGLEIAEVAPTSVCVCKSVPFLASVRQRHNGSIDSATDSATDSKNAARSTEGVQTSY
jgi:hypothetical protein